MSTRWSSFWISGIAFLGAVFLALLAGPSFGAFNLRALQATTGTHYHCVKYCEEGGEPVDTWDSDTPPPDDDGWECDSDKPVNFMTGANMFTRRDLSTRGLSRFSVARMYLQDAARSDHGLGPCWRIGWMYRIVRDGTTLSVVGGNHTIVSFTDNLNGTYTSDFNYVQTLTQDAANHLLVLTDAKGKRWNFFDFSGSWNPARQGRLKEFADRAGNLTTTIYGTSGVTSDQLLEVQQTDPNPAFFHRFTLAYNLSGPSMGLLASITHSRTISGVTTTVRVAEYTYYTSTSPNGPAGTLQRARVRDASSNILETCYYRYNATDGTGFVPLRVAVNPRAYDLMSAALGGDAAIDAASDAVVGVYSDYVFTYDLQKRVTQEVVQGQGCGCGSSGSRGTFTYAYAAASHGQPDSHNIWRQRTTVTLPDGNLRIVYLNGAGQTMLDIGKDASNGQQWMKYFAFNSDYSLAAVAFPSAVVGFSESNPSLVSGADLPDGTGLWHLYTYYSTTNIGLGQVAKYQNSRLVRQGELGTPIPVETITFSQRTGAAATIFPIATRTIYRNTDGTGGQTTSFSYTWQGTSTEVLQRTTTFPVVPTSQNGSGSATGFVVQLDAFGRLTWLKDEDGFLTNTSYDTLSGAVTQKIVDVNSTLVTPPSGWVTPAGGGLHLVTSRLVDALGRTTRATDPLGNITYMVYRDPQHEVRVYPGWNTSTNLPTGPTHLAREDHAGNYDEKLTMSAPPHLTAGVPDGTEAVSALQTLSRSHLDTGARAVHTDSYFNLTGLSYSTAPALGTQGTHFYRYLLGFDLKGRKNRTQDWAGTIHRKVYDSQDRLVSTWLGTNDTPASGDWSPTNNTAPANMIQMTGLQYDGGGTGDGTLTKRSVFTSAVSSLDTLYQVDFRHRLTQERGPDQVARQHTYDNLDQATMIRVYADNNTNFVLDPGELRAQGQAGFDEKSQRYQDIVFNVDPSTGAVGNSKTTSFWSNARAMTVKSRGANGELRKDQYDGAGRGKSSFISFDDAETLYADALTVSGDTVAEQVVWIYDAASNLIQRTRYQRTSTSTQLGELSVSWTAAKSRRTFDAQWFDKARRRTDLVDYGNNGGSNLSRPATAPLPNSSNNYIVTHFEFDAGGRQHRTTDNLARVTLRTYDALDRVTQSVENFTGTGIAVETDLDVNRTTNFVYDSSGRLSQRIALNPKGAGLGVQQQAARFVYGTTANQAFPAVFRNDVLVAEIEPDSDDTYDPLGGPGSQLGNGGDGAYDRLEYTYDYAGRKSTMKDPRGVVRTFAYDSSGRFSSDTLTTPLPAGVDGSVLRIGRTYDSLSRPLTVTSYSDVAGTTPVNQAGLAYDGWGNEIQCEQEHAGLVVPGVSAKYQTAFADGAVGGVAKYVRQSSMTYPNGRQVFVNYPAAGSLGDHLSRVDHVANDAAGTARFVQYTYLGTDLFGEVNHPLVTNGLQLLVATGGNPAQWDRFGRVLDHEWKATSGTVVHDRYKHTYDRVGNRLTRDVLASGAPTTQDQFYTYDGLERLTKMNRGTLSSGQITDANAKFSQKWPALESQGNWRSFHVAPTGANSYTFQQSRSHNNANEIDTDNSDGNPAGNSISGSGGADWVDPVSDKAGNLTVAPRVGQEASAALTLTYDGWNRMVKVQAGAAVLGEYQYDAWNRRAVKLVPNGANWDRTDYYYTCGWQTVEERQLLDTPSKTVVATMPRFQWIWDFRYIDAVVLRDENKDGDSSCTGAADQRLYYTQDPNWNTTALVDAAGVVQERYTYDAYGAVTVLNGAWGAQTAVFNNEIRFAGSRQDSETGLYLARNRYYHPSLGRWTRRDPIGYEAGSNLYRYCWDNPGNIVDSMGLDGKKETKTFYYTAGKSETWRRKDEPNKDKPYETYLHTITVTVDATSCKKGCVSCSGTPKASIDFESTISVVRLANAANIRRAGLYIKDKYYNSDEKGKAEKLPGSTYVASAPGVFETNCDDGKIEEEFLFILKPKEGEKETKATVLAQSYLLNLKATVDECGEKITIDLTMNFVNPKAIEGEGRLLKPIKDPNDPGRYPRE